MKDLTGYAENIIAIGEDLKEAIKNSQSVDCYEIVVDAVMVTYVRSGEYLDIRIPLTQETKFLFAPGKVIRVLK